MDSEEHQETSARVSRPSADKFAVWMTLSVSDRLDRIGSSIQKVRDIPYYTDDYQCIPKFQKGDPICLCCEGLYYHAVVQEVHKDQPFYCPEVKKNVPLYSVKYPGWAEKSKDEQVVEYDIMGTTRHTIAHELLYAHYWNHYKLERMKRKIGKQQMKSVFVLPERTLQKLEKKWMEQIKKEHPTEDLTFSQWVGL